MLMLDKSYVGTIYYFRALYQLFMNFYLQHESFLFIGAPKIQNFYLMIAKMRHCVAVF